MKDWILRKVVLSTGRKFIPVGKKRTYSFNQKENYIFRILGATPRDYRVDIVTGLKKIIIM